MCRANQGIGRRKKRGADEEVSGVEIVLLRHLPNELAAANELASEVHPRKVPIQEDELSAVLTRVRVDAQPLNALLLEPDLKVPKLVGALELL